MHGGMQGREQLSITFFLVCAFLLFSAACEVGDVHQHQVGESDPLDTCDSQESLPGQDPNLFEACCQDYGGGAHCVPPGLVPAEVRGLVATCASGALCIPDKFIAAGSVTPPRVCDSINGAGRCTSICIPQVQQFLDILTQDVCDDGERCAPCIDPLSNKPSGACDVACGDTGPRDPITCPYDGPALLAPEAYPPCPNCAVGGAHCLPKELLRPGDADLLEDCDASSKCVPDDFIRTMGKGVPATCASIGGGEGRCLSPCLPQVASKSERLSQGTCRPDQLCVPCTDPLTGETTEACSQTCDAPAEPPLVFPACCGGQGTCVPPSAAGADADRLGPDTCPESESYVCAPNVMIEGTYVAQACEASAVAFLLGEQYRPGACMPACLPDVDSFLLGQGSCADGYKCAPCLNPLGGGSSGACDYLAR